MFLNAFLGVLALTFAVGLASPYDSDIDSSTYPTSINLMGDASTLPRFDDYYGFSTGDHIDFLNYIGQDNYKLFYLQEAYASMNNGVFEVTSLGFAVYYADNLDSVFSTVRPVWGFCAYNYSANGRVSLREVGNIGLLRNSLVGESLGFISTSYNYVGSSSSSTTTFTCMDYVGSQIGPSPWSAYIDFDKLAYDLAPILLPLFQNAYDYNAYARGYAQGYRDGTLNGDSVGYNRGYGEGYDAGYVAATDNSAGGVFTSLAGGIISVPMNILAGLSVFTIFNTPIISIIITFMIAGLVLFIVKRFLK